MICHNSGADYSRPRNDRPKKVKVSVGITVSDIPGDEICRVEWCLDTEIIEKRLIVFYPVEAAGYTNAGGFGRNTIIIAHNTIRGARNPSNSAINTIIADHARIDGNDRISQAVQHRAIRYRTLVPNGDALVV